MASSKNAAQTILSQPSSSSPPSKWYLPDSVSHRGYNALYPENSMVAFRAALASGTHAFETDLHLTRDGVVVLSHDPTLKRCFGREERLKDCDWAFLSTLKTLREPHAGLARLADLLELMAQPDVGEEVWLVLDIKADDDPRELVEALGRTLREVKGPVPWEQRIVLACWNGNFLHHCEAILPGYSLALTSFSPHHVRKPPFRRYQHLGFNMLQLSLVGPLGARFLRWARDQERLVIGWTVNEECWMEWCIYENLRLGGGRPGKGQQQLENGNSQETLVASSDGRNAANGDVGGGAVVAVRGRRVIDAVITDDPKKYLAVCERVAREVEDSLARTGKLPKGPGMTWRMVGRVLLVHVLIVVVFTFQRFLGKRFRALGDNGPVGAAIKAEVKRVD